MRAELKLKLEREFGTSWCGWMRRPPRRNGRNTKQAPSKHTLHSPKSKHKNRKYAAIYKVSRSHLYKAAIEHNRLVRQHLDRSLVFWLSSPCSLFSMNSFNFLLLLGTDCFQSLRLLLSAESISSAVRATRSNVRLFPIPHPISLTSGWFFVFKCVMLIHTSINAVLSPTLPRF